MWAHRSHTELSDHVGTHIHTWSFVLEPHIHTWSYVLEPHIHTWSYVLAPHMELCVGVPLAPSVKNLQLYVTATWLRAPLF